MNREAHNLLKQQLDAYKGQDSYHFDQNDLLKKINQSYTEFKKNISELEKVLDSKSKKIQKENRFLKKELFENRKRLNYLINSIEGILFMVDENGDFSYINDAWYLATGIPVNKMKGKSIAEFYYMFKDNDVEVMLANRSVASIIKRTIQLNLDGQFKWYKVTINQSYNSDGTFSGAIGTILDVDNTKNTELELKKALEAKNDFLSIISHEIRTPLNTVIGMANVLKMEQHLPEQVDNLNALKFASEHLLGLINDILDYNKIEAHKLTFMSTTFDLKVMMKSIKESFEYATEEKQLNFSVDVEGDFTYSVIADRVRMFQIVSNLISNAIQNTPEGFIKTKVRLIEEDERFSKVYFEVSDSSPGIPAEKLNDFFDQFNQIKKHIDSTHSGTGLGLAISSNLLKMLGSELKVKSKVGEGSTFYFEYIFENGKPLSQFRCTERSKQYYVNNKKSLTILMAEDNEMNIKLIKRFFNLWNFKVDVAKNGIEAIDQVQRKKYDLVLMDIQMPKMDGFAASKVIRQLGDEYKNIPIIALTANVDSNLKEKAIGCGMNDFLTKPFNPEQFHSKIMHHSNEPLK